MRRSVHRRWMVISVLVAMQALLLMAACGQGSGPVVLPTEEVVPEGPAGEVVLGGEDNGGQVALSVGQSLVVTLASNPTTGYSWQVAEGTGTVLAQVGEAIYRETPQEGTPLVGVGGTETFRFEARAAGQTSLLLEYRRPWEETVEPVETFSVDVVVR
jgi:inhibitor of cysteine peptidase